MNDSYWAMVFDNISDIAQLVMIICVVLGLASMVVSCLSYKEARGNKESFEWRIFKKGKVMALSFLIIGIIAALAFIFTPNKSYYYDRMLEDYRIKNELLE